MAFLDTDQGQLVVRIVFDGSPLAGKTTTVESLAASLGVTVTSPEGMLGRTLFFDWLEYTGGLWNGHRIRCQVLTVPGQSSLGDRRFELLRMADCVVFVFEASTNQLSRSFSALEELGCVLNTCPAPKPRVLLQLNKRDLPSALPRSELDPLLPVEYQNVAETIATDSAGIRDVFVRAVRLALNRVEELREMGDLPISRPDVQNSEDLLAHLKAEGGRGVEPTARSVPLEAAAWSFLRSLESREVPGPVFVDQRLSQKTLRGTDSRSPLPPSSEVPAGSVWPPSRGRTTLKGLEGVPCHLSPLSQGDWEARFGTSWRGFSRVDHVFEDFEEGRNLLLDYARRAIRVEDWLSPRRCLVLSPADNKSWRLWEVMPITTPLHKLLLRRLRASAEVITAALTQIYLLYRRAATEWPDGKLNQELSPRVSGLYETRLVYTGFLAQSRRPAAEKDEPSTLADLRKLSLVFLEAQGIGLGDALRQLEDLKTSAMSEGARDLIQLLTSQSEPDLGTMDLTAADDSIFA